MAVFIKSVNPDTLTDEVELQTIAASYGFAPKVYNTTEDEIHMEDLQEMCIADKYGEDPKDIPAYIWVSIRTIIHTLYYKEGIEYIDITPYNFIEKDKKVYIIDFGHASYYKSKEMMNWFVKQFLEDGINDWNPDFK
jgi:tRNA A-37 threonylcarbamoyl transferase component Bud32